VVTGILQNTPYWVWGVFVLLLVVGLSQTRTRSVSRILVLVLPVVMVPLSFFAVAASFGIKPLPVIAWTLGIAAALALNSFIFHAPADVRYQRDAGKFEIPGSWVPLILMMVIFLARFAIGFTQATNPALVGTDAFAGIVSAILGICSGLFIARAMKIFSARSAAT
jgi:hypothetical protein